MVKEISFLSILFKDLFNSGETDLELYFTYRAT